MGKPFPKYPENLNGDEPTYAPTKSDRSLLAAERDTQNTKRLETDSDSNLYVNIAEGTVTTTPSGTQDVNIVSSDIDVPVSAIDLDIRDLNSSQDSVSIPVPVPVTDNGGSLTVDGAVSVSNFPAVQTVAISQTGTDNNVDANITNASIAVTGPLTDTELRASPVPVTIPTPVPVTDNGGSLTIDGTVTANLGTIDGVATETTLATRLAGNSSASSITRVASNSAASQQLLAANSSRKLAIFYNDSTGVQYLKFGTTASTTDFTVRMTSQSYYEVPVPVYTGRIDSISGNNNGAIQVTELT